MSLAALPAAILDTVLGRLAMLFLSGAAGDLTVARHAARQMLAAYHPETPDELRLAAEVVSFSFHAMEALGLAMTPDMPLTKILRLRGSAVSLSRESHKSQRKLDQLQTARRAGTPDQPVETPAAQPEPVRPSIDKALALIEATRQSVRTPSATSAPTWTQGYQQRKTARRITENLKKNRANHAASPNTAMSGAECAARSG